MATIQKYETKNGNRWRVRWRDDKNRQRSKSFDRQRLARDFMIKLEHETREGSYMEPSEMTLKEYLLKWIDSYSAGIAPNTERGYRVNLNHIINILGGIPVQKIIPSDIENAYKKLGEKLSGTSVLYIHRTLNIALKDAEKQKIIRRNPCDFVDAPKKSKFKPSFVEPNDVPKYLKIFEGHYLYPAVCLAMFCGLRRGEILGLQWQDVKWNKGLIIIRNNMTDDGLGDPKNGESRNVPLTKAMENVLKKQKKKQQYFMELMWDEYFRSDFIVTHDDGTIISPRALSKTFTRMIESNDVEKIRFHDLRHTAASLMLNEGIDLKVISEILGHSSISITADIYGHILDEKKKQAAHKLDKYLL